jgi:hypothetical protein
MVDRRCCRKRGGRGEVRSGERSGSWSVGGGRGISGGWRKRRARTRWGVLGIMVPS